MPTKEMIHSLIMSDRSIGISIREISDLVANYAESTLGDRLLMYIDQNCNVIVSDGKAIKLYQHGFAHVAKINTEVGPMINIAYSYSLGEPILWIYLFSREYWSPEHVMHKLSKINPRDRILKELYEAVMNIP